MSQTHFSLKLLAMTLESSYRHLAHNKNIKQNKNLGKMAAKMAVYYKHMGKFPTRPANSMDLHVKSWFYWVLSYGHHPCNIPVMHHLEFDIFKMAPIMIADTFYKPVGAAPNL